MNVRDMIIKSFTALLAKQAISSISVGQIIADAGISKPTFYRYFYNKYEILEPVMSAIMEPIGLTGDTLAFTDALRCTFENVYENRAIFKNGFKTDEQCSIRSGYMIHIADALITEVLDRKGADTSNASVAFSIRSLSITLCAAICGWACDSQHAAIDSTVKLITDAIPHSILRYIA